VASIGAQLQKKKAIKSPAKIYVKQNVLLQVDTLQSVVIYGEYDSKTEPCANIYLDLYLIIRFWLTD
jgi:hypothetical protein